MALLQVVGPIPTFATAPTQIQGGRLSLSSTLPVSADVTGATTIYLQPYSGRGIALWNSTLQAWRVLSIPDAGVSVAIGTLADGTKPYDVFAFDSSGSVAIEIGPVWTSTTLRATALVVADGVQTKSGDKTRRYLGTFMPTATTTTEDSKTNRYLWNNDNRVARGSNQQDATASWTYNSVTWVGVNTGNASWKHSFVNGLDEDDLYVFTSVLITNATGADGQISIGLDSSSAPATGADYGDNASNTTGATQRATWGGRPGLGQHFVQALNRQANGGALVATYNGSSAWSSFRTVTRR